MKNPILIADIGGTNARFALIEIGNDELQHVHVLPCANYAGITEAIEAYFALPDIAKLPRATKAAIAIANPITGDSVQMTNNHWRFSQSAVKKALGFSQFLLANDFTALALSLPHLKAHEMVQIGEGIAEPNKTIALIGPGTGLGVSGLIPAKNGDWIPLAAEGGHISFAPDSVEEDQLLSHLRHEFPHLCNENIICGPGLINLYKGLCAINGKTPQNLTPAQISQHAKDNADEMSQQTLALFCALLGSAAGNLALTLGASGGVYIGGGIVPSILEFFQKSTFRERFLAKGRVRFYLENIPTFVITARYPGLLGAAALLNA